MDEAFDKLNNSSLTQCHDADGSAWQFRVGLGKTNNKTIMAMTPRATMTARV
jgi:hypothetical protein